MSFKAANIQTADYFKSMIYGKHVLVTFFLWISPHIKKLEHFKLIICIAIKDLVMWGEQQTPDILSF